MLILEKAKLNRLLSFKNLLNIDINFCHEREDPLPKEVDEIDKNNPNKVLIDLHKDNSKDKNEKFIFLEVDLAWLLT